MESKELMVGNWVYESKRSSFPMKVVSLFDNTVYLNFEGNEGDVWEKNVKDIEPIPLTSDTLIKLGFWRHNIEGCDIHFKYTLPKINFELKAMYDSDYSVSISGQEVQIKYLHQLQNVLRLMGQEIDVVL